MSWEQIVRDYFTFSKKERIAGLTVIGSIIFCIFIAPRLFRKSDSFAHISIDTSLYQVIDTLQENYQTSNYTLSNEEDKGYIYTIEPLQPTSTIKGELFHFDPNTLSTEGWKRLGLQDRTINIINNYRNKGGRFYKKEDLRKIWGLPKDFYDRVANYISIIPSTNHFIKNESQVENNFHNFIKADKKSLIVEVNTADTMSLIALPGIGSKLAQRITNFRDKLGGFHSVEQISETYGLPDSTFVKLKPYLNVNVSAVRKINLNNATKDELKTHPYIKWNLANAIIEYRNQHGFFKDLQDLKNIVLIDESTFERIAPYLTL